MILYQQHIMWYESKMINETLDSLENALPYSSTPIKLSFCLNSQTYLETPMSGEPEDMFQEFIDHPILKNAEIIYKTNNDPFYNIGDWRREMYSPNSKYTVWGESDTLVPLEYFYILDSLQIQEPHILSLSSRKMWDGSWIPVEHISLQHNTSDHDILGILSCGSYISYPQLIEFNDQYGDIDIIKLNTNKIDGSLLSLSSNLPSPFISPDQHFVGEDTGAELFFQKKGIPQYHITNKIKGHNYNHPQKRTNTSNTRNDEIFKKYATESKQAMYKFLQYE